MGIEPGQAVYVGDNYFADVIGAQRAGMRAVLIDPEGLFPEADCPVIHKISELEFALD
jgi:FMN phosphatase YigB (HAD superfamily)